MIESPIALAPWLKNRETFEGMVVWWKDHAPVSDSISTQTTTTATEVLVAQPNRTKSPCPKGIESPTILDVGNTEALRGRHQNVTGRS